MLLEHDNWIDLFRTLEPCRPPVKQCRVRRPLVVAIRESDKGNQLLILSPSTSQEEMQHTPEQLTQ